MTIIASRLHDFSCGHRVVGHEGKCRNLHGHNYRAHFYCGARKLDVVGRVIDFSVIKQQLCMWIEEHWDHRFLVWTEDPLADSLQTVLGGTDASDSIVRVPFNPTAENLAQYLVDVVGPAQLKGTGVMVLGVRLEETRKCSASYTAPTAAERAR